MTRFADMVDIQDGEQVAIRGWMYNRRSSGGIQFLMVRDGTGVMQCTLDRSRVDELVGRPRQISLSAFIG
jgi:asparaginyl-tRNA synthetase